MPQTPVVNNDAKMRIAENKKLRASGMSWSDARNTQLSTPRLDPTVSATSLVTPPTPVTVPTPTLPSTDAGTLNIAKNVSRDLDGFISAQTEEAKQLKARQADFAMLGQQDSLSDLFSKTQQDYGVTPETFKELKDVQLQLAGLTEGSLGTQSDIARGAGQTINQGSREISAEQARNNVRSYGLAARAAVLQGNIETATQLARDTVNIAYQDRTLQSQNMIKQIEMLQGTVDDQTAQLLEQEKRQYEADLAAVKELKDNVASAMVSGATQSEITTLNDPEIPDAEKLALAQQITARGATQMRNLEIGQMNASIRSANASAALNEAELTAFNKAQEDAAAGILSPEQMETANKVNADFEKQPIVQAYNEGLQNMIVLEDTLENGVQGIQDVQLVYSFMKAIDPTSVVKDDEFDKVASSGNIFAGAYQKFNKGYLGAGGFLPDNVKDSLINTARAGFEARNTQYYNVKSEYAKRMNNTVGVGNGADYLTAYEAAAPLTQVDFGLADSLSNATPDEIADIMLRTEGLVGTNIYAQ